jgi:hypothetical protein
MSLLGIIGGPGGVAARLSLPVPSAVVGSSDKQVIQLLALVNQEGRSLARRGPWQALVEEASFVTTATPAQAAATPADFDRIAPNSIFNRSTRRPVYGPVTPQQWQSIQAQPVCSTVYLAYRRRSGQFLITPTPPAGETIAYEYVSANWARSAGGAAQPQFQADTDLAYLDEELITLGAVWRYLRAKGLDYAEEMASYEREVEQALARDGGSTALSIAPQPVDLGRLNLPDGSFGI